MSEEQEKGPEPGEELAAVAAEIAELEDRQQIISRKRAEADADLRAEGLSVQGELDGLYERRRALLAELAGGGEAGG